MEKDKYVAVIEVELPVNCDSNAILIAQKLCKEIGKGNPKLSEIYKEENAERRLVYNE